MKNEELKNFIVCCLKPESERPSAEFLLELPYLNEIENEENNRAVELLTENEVNIETENTLSKNRICKESSNLNLENIEEKFENLEKKQNCQNTTINSWNVNFFTKNSLFIKDKDGPIIINSKNTIKNRPKEICTNSNFNSNSTYSFPTNTNPSTPSNINSTYISSNQLNPIQSNKPNLNSVIERRASTIGLYNKNLMRQTSSNVIQNNIPFMSCDSKLHKVSLKNSLNLNQIKVNFLKFEVNIQAKTESTGNVVNSSQTPIFQSSQILNLEKNELEIIFIVHRGDWTNGKSKIYSMLFFQSW